MNQPVPNLQDDFLVVNSRVRVPMSELSFTFARSSGPGGQNVNKVNSKAQMRWPVAATESLPEDVKQRFLTRHVRRITNEGEFLLNSQRYRDQPRNIADCLEKLRALLAEVAVAPTPRKKKKPTRGSKERRLKSKRETSEKKERRKPIRFD